MPTAALALAVLFHAAPLQTESQKIEALIKHLESLTDVRADRGDGHDKGCNEDPDAWERHQNLRPIRA